MNRIITGVAVAAGVAACALVGVGAGAALATGTILAAPSGLSAADGSPTIPMPEPKYPTNDDGLTYGSSADAISPETEPDLIHVVATNGVLGYVKKADLDLADGTAAAAGFRSPQDALEWQATEGQKDHSVTVYDVDGKTAVGEFIVYGQASTAQQVADAEADARD